MSVYIKCPSCGCVLVRRDGQYGEFVGCSNYPKCKIAYWDKPTGEVCPECGKLLVTKNGTIKCSECSYEKEV